MTALTPLTSIAENFIDKVEEENLSFYEWIKDISTAAGSNLLSTTAKYLLQNVKTLYGKPDGKDEYMEIKNHQEIRLSENGEIGEIDGTKFTNISVKTLDIESICKETLAIGAQLRKN